LGLIERLIEDNATEEEKETASRTVDRAEGNKTDQQQGEGGGNADEYFFSGETQRKGHGSELGLVGMVRD
jgi:hypothetical protein